MRGRVLIIAGSDSGGGAGIQADIKTVTALGGFAMTAITALTAQNTQGVHGVMAVPEAFIAQQIDVVLSDIGADVIKTGMLHSTAVIEAVLAALEKYRDIPLVVDPVMVAKGGASLLQDDAVKTLQAKLLPRAFVVTPNVPEARALTGVEIVTDADRQNAGEALLNFGANAVLLKGGHLEGPEVEDWLVMPEETRRFTSARIDTRHTHGTGCTLASAIATGLAYGLTLPEAVRQARDYVWQAIVTAPGFGAGHGPLNHGHAILRQSAVN
jgi:hydroxymethylpyrimidine/phosphomethylpyrimidine kinase